MSRTRPLPRALRRGGARGQLRSEETQCVCVSVCVASSSYAVLRECTYCVICCAGEEGPARESYEEEDDEGGKNTRVHRERTRTRARRRERIGCSCLSHGHTQREGGRIRYSSLVPSYSKCRPHTRVCTKTERRSKTNGGNQSIFLCTRVMSRTSSTSLPIVMQGEHEDERGVST